MSRKRRKWTFGHFFFGVSFFTVLAVLGGGVGCYFLLSQEFPNVSVLKTQYPLVKYKGPKNPPDVTLQKSRPVQWVGLGDISRVAVGAVVVSEDWAFYQHKGYDPNQIKEAIKEDWEEGEFVRGASTITQQVVRNVFLDKDKNLWRKLKEFILAIQLEKTVGKRKILETYLNIAEWGPGIFGIQAASQYYFGKSAGQLTAKEGAFLAMLLPSPIRYGQSFRKKELTDYAKDTVENILRKMTQAQYISEQERDQEFSAPLSFESPSPSAL